MPDSGGTSPEGLTRREALKRGAIFGGALLWATPLVQAVGMSRAVAEEPSVGNCKTYCIKYEFGLDDENLDDGIWTNLGNGQGNCLVCPPPPDAVNGGPPGFPNNFFVYGGTRKTEVWVHIPENCSPADLEDPSPDPHYPGVTVATKCGQSCSLQSPDVVPDPIYGGNRVRVDACDPPDGPTISHIELIISCCT